jgi:prophage regulatory protein
LIAPTKPSAPAPASLVNIVKEDRAMARTLLRLRQVLERTGLSRSELYRAQQAKKFPSSVPLGERTVAWVADEIDAWIEDKIAAGRRAAARALPAGAAANRERARKRRELALANPTAASAKRKTARASTPPTRTGRRASSEPASTELEEA